MSGRATAGGCLCGAVRYRLAEPPKGYDACHCGMCRRWSGGVLLAIEVPQGGIEWTGEERVAVHRSSDWAERGFCRECGSNLFWRLASGTMLAVCAGSLDSLDGLELSHEIFIDHKPAGHAFAGERRRMTEAEVMAMMGAAPKGGAA